MAEELDLASLKHQGFDPAPFYNAKADCLFVFFKDTEYYAERLDSVMTVFHAMGDGAIVGFQIKGIRKILQRMRAEGVGYFSRHWKTSDMSLALLIEASRLYAQSSLDRYHGILSEAATRPFRVPTELTKELV